MTLKQGDRIADRYEIITPVKAGGMGAVYKAYDMHFKWRIVALKEMLQDFSSDETRDLVRRKFEEEANILVKLRHKGIPQVFDHLMEGEICYIVMDFIEGTNLEKLLEEYLVLTGKPVREDYVANYAIQICEILEYLHGQKPEPIIHRDIKPGNIILRKEKQEVILVDFGLARGIDTSSLSTKTLVGTVGYAPLEQFKGMPETRSDIYGLGATMHHMISGVRPTPFSLEPLEKVYRNANKGLAAIVNRSIAEEPGDRFASATEMKKALLEVLPSLKGAAEMPSDEIEAGSARDIEHIPTGVLTGQAETRKDTMMKRTAVEDLTAVHTARTSARLSDFQENQIYKRPAVIVGTVIAALLLIVSGICTLAKNAERHRRFSIFSAGYRAVAPSTWNFLWDEGFSLQGQSVRISTVEAKRGFIVFQHKKGRAASENELSYTVTSIENTCNFIVFWGDYGILTRDSSFDVLNEEKRTMESGGEKSRYIISLVKLSGIQNLGRNTRLTSVETSFEELDPEKGKIRIPASALGEKAVLTYRISFQGSQCVFSVNGAGAPGCPMELGQTPSEHQYFGVFFPSTDDQSIVISDVRFD